jgi:hypothetical protein
MKRIQQNDTFSKYIDYKTEVSKNPVDVQWNFKQDGIWYGSFEVNSKEYNIMFEREDKKHNLPYCIVSLKFDRPDQNDPHAFSKDFNQPLVVANTVKNSLNEYFKIESIDMFIIKAFSKEQSRVKKYRQIAFNLSGIGQKLPICIERERGNYTYFILYRTAEIYDDVVKKLEEQKLFN